MDPLLLYLVVIFCVIMIDIHVFHDRKSMLQEELKQRSTLTQPDWDKVEASIPEALGREGVVQEAQNR